MPSLARPWRARFTPAALVTLIAALHGASLALAQTDGSAPSAEDIRWVEERRASFPVRQIVESVDWYRPLVTVRGRPQSFASGTPLRGHLALELRQHAEQTESFALLVAHNGRIVFEHYAAGFNRLSRFDTASMHKAVVALLVGAAIDDGAIRGVDEPLSAYLSDLPDDGREHITLAQLLEMRSGLQTPPISNSAASPYWQTYFGRNLRWSIAQWPMRPETTGQFYYANANTQYLMWVIEQATGMGYADYLSQRLWRRIGADDARLWIDREGGSPRGFCCLQASGRDWLRIGELIRMEGRWRGRQVISRGWIRAIVAPSPANPNFGRQLWRGSPFNPERTYGPGIPAVIRSAAPFVRDDTVFIDGSGGQRVYVIPSAGLTIVRIGRPRSDWDDSYLPNLAVRLVAASR